jgi:hypothetical protein
MRNSFSLKRAQAIIIVPIYDETLFTAMFLSYASFLTLGALL